VRKLKELGKEMMGRRGMLDVGHDARVFADYKPGLSEAGRNRK
jgi:hypothetical protein